MSATTTRLSQFVQRNDPPPGPGAIQNRRPYPQWGAVRSVEYGGFGTYNALQVKLQSRDWHGSSFLVSYTFNKCLDNGSSESTATWLLVPINKAVCDFSIPNNFVASYTYALPVGRDRPFLKNMPSVAECILEAGWSRGSRRCSQACRSRRRSAETRPIPGSRAASESVGNPAMVGTVSCWFYVAANPGCQAADPGGSAAFSLPAQYTYGTSGRNILRADSLVQFDFTVTKQFKFTETKSLQFRAEFFNIFNTPTFVAPGTTIDTSSGGQIASTLNGGRTIELALKLFF